MHFVALDISSVYVALLCTLFPLFNDVILGDSTVQSNQKENAKKVHLMFRIGFCTKYYFLGYTSLLPCVT